MNVPCQHRTDASFSRAGTSAAVFPTKMAKWGVTNLGHLGNLGLALSKTRSRSCQDGQHCQAQVGRKPVPQPQTAFTLVELLVVVAIIALLAAILLPSLTEARAAAKRVQCGSNLRQIGLAIRLYADECGGFVPRGPATANPFDFAGDQTATNQLWIGTGTGGFPAFHPREYTGLGRLLTTTGRDPEMLFSPADERHVRGTEAPRIGTADDAYGSYLYRQLDQLPEDAQQGRLDNLGRNRIGDEVVPVQVLALDANSLGEGPYYQVNHNALRVNLLFRDGSVTNVPNAGRCLAIPSEAFVDPGRLSAMLDQLLIDADYAYTGGKPWQAPRLSSPN